MAGAGLLARIRGLPWLQSDLTVTIAWENNITVSYRLVSFMTQIQDAIARREGQCPEGSRMVNFHKGIARFSMKDGGAIQVQAFELADGQTCLKIALYWAGIKTPAIQSVYPTAPDFDYIKAAGRIAQTWIDGPLSAGINFGDMGGSSEPSLSKLSPIG